MAKWRANTFNSYKIDDIYEVEVYTNGEVKVKSHSPRKKGGYLKPEMNTNGYIRFNFNGRNNHQYAHTLVAYGFLGERPKGYDVNHKDGNKLNNHPDNLEYVTRKQNLFHARTTGLNAPFITTDRATYKREWARKNREKLNAI